MWTSFQDMHSGGYAKEGDVYIEAPERVAIEIFTRMFDFHPFRVTCHCCGADYATMEHDTLEQATGYERACHYDRSTHRYLERPTEERYGREWQSLDEWLAKGSAKVVYSPWKEG